LSLPALNRLNPWIFSGGRTLKYFASQNQPKVLA
jgi:hypothetical protein